MDITVNGQSVTLTDAQLKEAWTEYNQYILEDLAGSALERYLQRRRWKPHYPHPSAIFVPWRVDYISDRIAKRFLKIRRNTIADNISWKKAIEWVLVQREKQFQGIPEPTILGPWLRRPFSELCELIYRGRVDMQPATFCLGQIPGDDPAMMYTVSYHRSEDGLIYADVQSDHSRLSVLLDPRYDSQKELPKMLRESLKEDLRRRGKQPGKFVWVRS